jgi:hypothetical protein
MMDAGEVNIKERIWMCKMAYSVLKEDMKLDECDGLGTNTQSGPSAHWPPRPSAHWPPPIIIYGIN